MRESVCIRDKGCVIESVCMRDKECDGECVRESKRWTEEDI